MAAPAESQWPNSDVVKPWANGFELSRRPQAQWIIDFGNTLGEAAAALYEKPFGYVVQHVKAERILNNREAYRKYWWRFAEPRPGLRVALKTLHRFIATVAHSKHRFFVWLTVPLESVPHSRVTNWPAWPEPQASFARTARG